VRSHCVALTKQRRAGLRLTPPQRLLVRYVMASECDVDWWWVTIYVLTSSDHALSFPVVTSRGSHWIKSRLPNRPAGASGREGRRRRTGGVIARIKPEGTAAERPVMRGCEPGQINKATSLL
jgi:hypothetical protein